MSSHVKIKICGIKNTQTLDTTLRAGADMVGFVHFPKSPRHLEMHQISTLIEATSKVEATSKRAQTVVLLVNPDWELLEEVCSLKPDFIQLHGAENPDFVAQIIERFKQSVLKALSVGNVDDLHAIPSYIAAGAQILLDAKPPKNATRPGGLGAVFDWKILDALDENIEYMLSGGLDPTNVADAIKTLAPFGVDVSSGVEYAPGHKDHLMIKEFITNARSSTHK